MVTKEFLQKKTRPELSEYCRKHGIKGYSGKTKAERINLILKAEGSGGPSMKKIISEARKGPEEYLKWARKEKEKSRLKLYIFRSSIRQNGIGEVEYVIATTSKRNAINRIVDVSLKKRRSNWVSQRIHVSDEVPGDLRKVEGFEGFNMPEVLYMIETQEKRGNQISWLKTPRIIKTWDESGKFHGKKKAISKKKPAVKMPGYFPPTSEVRKQKRIKELKDDLEYWEGAKKRHEKEGLEEARKKRKEHYAKASASTDKGTRKMYYKFADDTMKRYSKQTDKINREIGKASQGIISWKMDYNRIVRIVKSTGLSKSKFNRSSMVRGYGEHTTGYSVLKPTTRDKKIVISWYVRFWAKDEGRASSIKSFKNTIIPALKLNNIKFKEEESSIVIE
jgi:hypothetical protein